MKTYVILKRDGQVAGCCEDDAKLPKRAIETPRLPEAYEKWDRREGAWVKDDAARANAAREAASETILQIADLPKQLNDMRLWLAAVGLPCPIHEIAERFDRIDAARAGSNRNEGQT